MTKLSFIILFLLVFSIINIQNTESLNLNIPNFFNKQTKAVKPSSELDKLLESNALKPWRASKVKYLTYEYRPWKDSWKERFRTPEDENIVLYSIPQTRNVWDKTRVDDIWFWPWLWAKPKTDRLSWIHKIFYADVEAMTVQDHMELDAFFSEFDMPNRWKLLRFKEADVFVAASLNLAFFTNFNGIKPTDLGLRPDGSLHTCPVQIHTCISSSNDPLNSHYAPPMRWSRSKSPDQAYEEVKQAYFNYPKKGLKYSSGWIDRGGYRPIEFGGSYFYSQADSLLYQFTDDIELVMNAEKREVYYRSAGRVGPYDWDTERLRYNQFARMLAVNGGWEVQQLERENWLTMLPFHWTQQMLDGIGDSVLNAQDSLMRTSPITGSGHSGGEQLQSTLTGEIMQTIQNILQTIEPYFNPIVSEVNGVVEQLIVDPRVAAAIQELNDLLHNIQNSVPNVLSSTELQGYEDRVSHLFGAEQLNEVPSKVIDYLKSFLQGPFVPAPDPGQLLSEQQLLQMSDGQLDTQPALSTMMLPLPASPATSPTSMVTEQESTITTNSASSIADKPWRKAITAVKPSSDNTATSTGGSSTSVMTKSPSDDEGNTPLLINSNSNNNKNNENTAVEWVVEQSDQKTATTAANNLATLRPSTNKDSSSSSVGVQLSAFDKRILQLQLQHLKEKFDVLATH